MKQGSGRPVHGHPPLDPSPGHLSRMAVRVVVRTVVKKQEDKVAGQDLTYRCCRSAGRL